MSDERDTTTRGSDVPGDLIKERENFVRSFLRKGVEYTEAFLDQNRELRERLEAVEAENAQLRSQLASDDAIRDLLRSIERLEGERKALLDRSSKLERTEREATVRTEAIEQEFNDLANLYVASFQLHASLSVRRVIRHIADMLGQLVGARKFAIYVLDENGKQAIPVHHEGYEDGLAPSPVDGGVGPVGEACLTGIARIQETPNNDDPPVAIVPLMADGRPVGCVEVIDLLGQKDGWANVDHELFQLLGAHAGSALIAANLYNETGRGHAALAGLPEKVKGGASGA